MNSNLSMSHLYLAIGNTCYYFVVSRFYFIHCSAISHQKLASNIEVTNSKVFFIAITLLLLSLAIAKEKTGKIHELYLYRHSTFLSSYAFFLARSLAIRNTAHKIRVAEENNDEKQSIFDKFLDRMTQLHCSLYSTRNNRRKRIRLILLSFQWEDPFFLYESHSVKKQKKIEKKHKNSLFLPCFVFLLDQQFIFFQQQARHRVFRNCLYFLDYLK